MVPGERRALRTVRDYSPGTRPRLRWLQALEESRPVMENFRRRWLVDWLLEGVEGSVARARRWGGASRPKGDRAKAQVGEQCIQADHVAEY